MARSIGDTLGNEIGVVSTPEITRYTLTSADQFIVTATDGIWDVMDNQEVVNFVEYFRGLAQYADTRPSGRDEAVCVSNACIAQLL